MFRHVVLAIVLCFMSGEAFASDITVIVKGVEPSESGETLLLDTDQGVFTVAPAVSGMVDRNAEAALEALAIAMDRNTPATLTYKDMGQAKLVYGIRYAKGSFVAQLPQDESPVAVKPQAVQPATGAQPAPQAAIAEATPKPKTEKTGSNAISKALSLRRVETVFTGIANSNDGKSLVVSTQAGAFAVIGAQSGGIEPDAEKSLRDSFVKLQPGAKCTLFLATINGQEGVFGVRTQNVEDLAYIILDQPVYPARILEKGGVCAASPKWASGDWNDSEGYFGKTLSFDAGNITSLEDEWFRPDAKVLMLMSNGNEYIQFLGKQRNPRLRIQVADFATRKLPRLERNFIRNAQGESSFVLVNIAVKDMEILEGLLSLRTEGVGINCTFADYLSSTSVAVDGRNASPVADFTCLTSSPHVERLLKLYSQDRGGWNAFKWGMTRTDVENIFKAEIHSAAGPGKFEYGYPAKTIEGLVHGVGAGELAGVKINCFFYAGALMRCDVDVSQMKQEDVTKTMKDKYSCKEHKIFIPSNAKEVETLIEGIKKTPLLMGEIRLKARAMGLSDSEYFDAMRKTQVHPDRYKYMYTGQLDGTRVVYDVDKGLVSYMDAEAIMMIEGATVQKNDAPAQEKKQPEL